MIYLTTYDPETQQCTAASVDSGFTDLGQVVEMMGPPLREGPRLLTYPDGVAFTDFILRYEP